MATKFPSSGKPSLILIPIFYRVPLALGVKSFQVTSARKRFLMKLIRRDFMDTLSAIVGASGSQVTPGRDTLRAVRTVK